MEKAGLKPPVFESHRGNFKTILYNEPIPKENESVSEKTEAAVSSEHPVKERILAFCNTPRSKEEIAEYLGIRSVYYVVSKYLKPMCAANPLSMTHPDKPKSRHQKYFTVRKSEMD